MNWWHDGNMAFEFIACINWGRLPSPHHSTQIKCSHLRQVFVSSVERVSYLSWFICQICFHCTVWHFVSINTQTSISAKCNKFFCNILRSLLFCSQIRKLIMCIQTDGNTLIDIKMSYSLSPLRKTCLPPSWVCRSLYDPPAGPWPRLHKTTWIWTAQRHQRVSVDCILVLWIWWYSWECLFKKTNFSNCMRILFYTLSYKFRSGDD